MHVALHLKARGSHKELERVLALIALAPRKLHNPVACEQTAFSTCFSRAGTGAAALLLEDRLPGRP
jgi:hypothetical protein